MEMIKEKLKNPKVAFVVGFILGLICHGISTKEMLKIIS